MLRHFRPGWPITLFAGVFIPLFVGLGIWQTLRAQEKQALLAQVALTQAQAPTSLAMALALEDPNFQPVTLEGPSKPEQLIYLDNRVRDGIPGVEVLLPVNSESRWVLVNLGFMAKPGRIELPPAPVLPQRVSLQGYLYRPDKPRVVLDNTVTPAWPLLLQRLDFEQIEQALGVELVPYQVRIDPQSGLAQQTDWVVSVSGPERHQGYAVQWFAMALALTILYGWVGIRREQHAA